MFWNQQQYGLLLSILLSYLESQLSNVLILTAMLRHTTAVYIKTTLATRAAYMLTLDVLTLALNVTLTLLLTLILTLP